MKQKARHVTAYDRFGCKRKVKRNAVRVHAIAHITTSAHSMVQTGDSGSSRLRAMAQGLGRKLRRSTVVVSGRVSCQRKEYLVDASLRCIVVFASVAVPKRFPVHSNSPSVIKARRPCLCACPRLSSCRHDQGEMRIVCCLDSYPAGWLARFNR